MKNVLTAEGVAEQLRLHKGNMSSVARHFGVTRQSVFGFVKNRPTLDAICVECRETRKDVAESKLDSAVEAGDSWAIQFFLKTQARDRGYGDTMDHNVRGGLRIYLPDNGRGDAGHGAGDADEDEEEEV